MSPSTRAGRPAFVLGLDGENLELLERFVAAFDMPVLGGMLARGRRGLLDPWINPLTPPSWTSFLTGTWFPRHGIEGFVLHDPATRRDSLARFADIRGETLLEAADRQGFRTLCLNMPMTWPPPALRRGVVVSGFDTPGAEAAFASPPGLESRLRARIPGYDASLPVRKGAPGDRAARAAYLAVLLERVRWRRQALEVLLEEGVPRLALVQVQETDILHHKAWDLLAGDGIPGGTEGDLLRALYQEVDGLAGDLRDAMGPEALGLVLSDHGGCAGRFVVQVNVLLAEWGFARSLEGADGSLARPDEVGRGVRARGVRLVRRVLRRPLLDEQGTIDAAGFVGREIQLDWGRTRAYLAVGDHMGVLHAGDGPPLEAAETEALAERLRGLRLPDGTAAMRKVLPGAEVFGPAGVQGAALPLLVLVPEDGVFLGRRTGGAAFVPYAPEIGSHRRHGMVLWDGPGVVPGMDPDPLPIVDALPTLFAAAGLAVPAGLDGRSRAAIFGAASGTPDLAPLEGNRAAGEEPTAEEEAELRARLEDLGYMG